MSNRIQDELKISDWVLDYSKRSRGIAEPRQRFLKFVETLRDFSAESTAHVLQIIFRDPFLWRSKDFFKEFRLDVIRFSQDLTQLGYERISGAYTKAKEENWYEVMAILKPWSERKNTEFEEDIPESFFNKLQALTTGERRALSKNQNRKSFELLIFDSEPLVIRDLLQNPRITQKEVIRISSRHQAPSAILEEVALSPKWSPMYRVRKALAFNPSTPRGYRVAYILELKPEDLSLFVEKYHQDEDLCSIARHRLKVDQS